MGQHPYHAYREYQASHRRVGTRLKGEPEGATKHATGKAFSNVTSKTAAASHDSKVEGKSAPKRYARGGNVKHSDEAQDRKLITKMMAEHERKEGEKGYARGGKVKGSTTNIAIVLPGGKGDAPDMPMPMPPMAGGPPPMPGPSGPPGMPPGLPPGLPMRARGGKVDGESTKADLKKWSKRASDNSYFRGGAATGVGREEKAAHMRQKRK